MWIILIWSTFRLFLIILYYKQGWFEFPFLFNNFLTINSQEWNCCVCTFLRVWHTLSNCSPESCANSYFHQCTGDLTVLWSLSNSSIVIPFHFCAFGNWKIISYLHSFDYMWGWTSFPLSEFFFTQLCEHFAVSVFNILIQYIYLRPVYLEPGGALGAWMDTGWGGFFSKYIHVYWQVLLWTCYYR